MNKDEIEYTIKTDRNTGEIVFSRGDYSFKQWGVRHEIIDLIDKLQQENKELKEKCEFEIKCNIEFADRIDKAIDKLKHTIHFIGKDKNGVEKEWVYLIDIEKELSEILKGDSNE